MALAIAILAAGKGTRLRSRRPKVLHTIGGKTLLAHVIDAALQVVPANDIYVIVGHQAETVQAAVAQKGVRFVVQSEQRGTGHAMQQALSSLRNYAEVLVLSGDSPLLQSSTISALRDFHIRERAAMTILSAEVANPFGYGRILRKAPGSADVLAIVEQKAATAKQQAIREINSGMYAFGIEHLMAHVDLLRESDGQSEIYLTDLASMLHKKGERVLAMEAPSATEVLGANTIEEMMDLDAALRRRIASRHMANGVTIFQPQTVIIDEDVEIGPDTTIEPFVQLLGATRIGSDSLVRSYSVLENTVVGRNVSIFQGCMLEGSEIRDGARIGPFARIRPQSVVEEEVHVGNFVELKKTHMGRGAKANHLAYLGDTEVGAEANVGAGTIVCNYDGTEKHKTRIGAGAFIGSDAVLVAPVTIGAGAYVAAGSCITANVPDQALAIARVPQVIKEGWVGQKRLRARQKLKK
jgi:bifunctional UDP-N-acetylglucosamine pyrophosphorylase/glucosamine-1-phosphate N-acetyltransferase